MRSDSFTILNRTIPVRKKITIKNIQFAKSSFREKVNGRTVSQINK
jgi:hypothetical protein